MTLKKKSHLRSIKVPGEAAGADGEAAASSPGDGAEIIQEGATLTNRFSSRQSSLLLEGDAI